MVQALTFASDFKLGHYMKSMQIGRLQVVSNFIFKLLPGLCFGVRCVFNRIIHIVDWCGSEIRLLPLLSLEQCNSVFKHGCSLIFRNMITFLLLQHFWRLQQWYVFSYTEGRVSSDGYCHHLSLTQEICRFICPSTEVFGTASIIVSHSPTFVLYYSEINKFTLQWGVIGPQRQFAKGQTY